MTLLGVHAAAPSAEVDGVSPITAFALLLTASVSCTETPAEVKKDSLNTTGMLHVCHDHGQHISTCHAEPQSSQAYMCLLIA